MEGTAKAPSPECAFFAQDPSFWASKHNGAARMWLLGQDGVLEASLQGACQGANSDQGRFRWIRKNFPDLNLDWKGGLSALIQAILGNVFFGPGDVNPQLGDPCLDFQVSLLEGIRSLVELATLRGRREGQSRKSSLSFEWKFGEVNRLGEGLQEPCFPFC